jgi:hypothetical protein
MAMNRYRAGLPMMALKGRLTSATSKTTFSMRKFSSVPNVTGSVMLLRGYTGCGPTVTPQVLLRESTQGYPF